MSAGTIQRALVVSFSVVPSSDHQGVAIETVVRTLAPRFQVDVLTIRSGDMGYVERYRRTRMLRVPVSSGSLREQVDAFRRAVRRQLEGAEYDLIHFRSAWGGVPVCQLKEYLDSKLVYELGITSSTEGGRIDTQSLQTLITDERFCVDHADLLLTQGESACRSLQASGVGCPVAVVPPGVDIDTFDWEPAVPQAQRRVLYVGTVGPGRGLRTLLEAFAGVLHYVDAHLVLVGTIEPLFTDYLQDALSRLGLVNHVHLVGPVDHEELPRILAMADVCVCPSAPDASRPLSGPPFKLLEYLACRRPCVAVDTPVIRELMGPVPALRLVPPEAAGPLAAAIVSLLTEPGQSADMAEAGYDLVRERYSASAARRALLAAYGRIFPAAASLLGHQGVMRATGSGITQSRSGSDRFRDTLSYDGHTVTVTPTGIGGGETPGGDPWVLVRPDSSVDFAAPVDHADAGTDPQFVAAGELLTGSAERAEHPVRPPREDTNPEGTSGGGPPPPLPAGATE